MVKIMCCSSCTSALGFSPFFFLFLCKTQTYTCLTFYRVASAIKADGLQAIVFRMRVVRTCREWDPRHWGRPVWASYNGPVRDAATRPDCKVSTVRDDSPTPTRPPRVRAPAPERSSCLSFSLSPPSFPRVYPPSPPFPPCGISHARATHTRNVAAAWEHFRVFPRSPRRLSDHRESNERNERRINIPFPSFHVTRANTRRPPWSHNRETKTRRRNSGLHYWGGKERGGTTQHASQRALWYRMTERVGARETRVTREMTSWTRGRWANSIDRRASYRSERHVTTSSSSDRKRADQ